MFYVSDDTFMATFVTVRYPLARFHAKTTIGPQWFHLLQCYLVIQFRGSD
jgi:hypothetical protein